MKRALLFVVMCSLVAGCYFMRPSGGGGEGESEGDRPVNAGDIALPDGYVIEMVAEGLTFPTGVAFDDEGVPYVVESGYAYGEVWTTPQLLRIEPGVGRTVIAFGNARNGPWNGVAYAKGRFFVAEGGTLEGGRILAIKPGADPTPGDPQKPPGSTAEVQILVDKLPSQGDHHTNGPAIGPDGSVYFGQGTATNSAVVGTDNHEFGWLQRQPQFHDIPCQNVRLTGVNFPSRHPEDGREVQTGAFVPYGEETLKNQKIDGEVPCNGAVMKVSPTGGKPKLVAWGFRNPFGLAFSPKGQLYVADNGYDDRGSRPVWGAADLLWAVKPGTWYGWPDFSGERPLTDKHFKPPGQPETKFVLKNHPNKVPRPAAYFGVHSSSNGLDFSRSKAFGHHGEAFVAQFGDQTPTTGKTLSPVGFKVVRVNVSTGRIEDFAVNRSKEPGPASVVGGGGLERPVAVRFDPTGEMLYVVDFGVLLMSGKGPEPQPRTGVLWRIKRATP